MKAALLQLTSGTDPAENFAAVAAMVRDTDAAFVLSPEMTPLLQKDADALQAAVRPEDETIAPYRDLARDRDIHFLLGSAAIRREDGRIANRSVLIDPDGAVIARYDKIHLFEAALPGGESYRESDAYAPGDAPVTTSVGGLKLGLSICYDVRFPSLYIGYALDGVDMIAVPSAFTRATGKAHWETLLRARAIESGAWVLAPAQAGSHADGRRTWGRTMAVAPWGEVAGVLDHDRPGPLKVDIDPKAVGDARARIPAWRQR
ncbi:carbon-nitrogen hydrolase family protein [uncultured Algimonas sp.]|uniref:carbon-nitrogen hydrolase family protein n=1 Tax=uncultured Algimonas sp. TaxID=1547920 RepID=UPI002634D059|nr:carbon-nitrogen hydrolase family protein [uncultured Algimonas sp.]